MKKVQLPVIGGVRKVIQVPGAASVGTTIAEVGSGTVTLAQLAAAINNILNNTGTTVPPGNAAPSASLVLGPGLSGGGVLIGNVPLRLTAPIPALLAEDGADGDIGPPGIQGPIGHTGPQGPAGSGTGSGSGGVTIWIPEDTSYDDFLVPGPAGAAGATGAVGATGPQGPQGPAGSGSGSGGTGTFQMWVPEDTSYDDTIDAPGLVNGQNGAMRVLNVISTLVLGGGGVVPPANATLVFPGATPQILASGPSALLQIAAASTIQLGVIGGALGAVEVQAAGNVLIGGSTSGPALTVQPSTGTLSGMSIVAGNGTTAVANTLWKTNTGVVLATMYSNGSFVMGTAGVAALTTSTIVVPNGGILGGMTVSTQGQVTIATPSVAGATALTIYDSVGAPLSVFGSSGTNIMTLASTGLITLNPVGVAAIFINCAPAVAAFTAVATAGNGVVFSFRGNANPGGAAFQLGQDGSGNGTISQLTTNTPILISVNGAQRMAIASNGITTYSASVGVQGVTPPVTAGQTDIGITTTATVITTVGGIGLPALASTFWVVNVNGVAYGVPCFAL